MLTFILVMDYMKLFGQVSEPNESDLLRNSVHQIHLHADWHAHESEHELYHASHSFSSMMQGWDTNSLYYSYGYDVLLVLARMC